MAQKIVEVFLQDRLVGSDPVVILLDRHVMDEDFVEQVKERMGAASYSRDDIACAGFLSAPCSIASTRISITPLWHAHG